MKNKKTFFLKVAIFALFLIAIVYAGTDNKQTHPIGEIINGIDDRGDTFTGHVNISGANLTMSDYQCFNFGSASWCEDSSLGGFLKIGASSYITMEGAGNWKIDNDEFTMGAAEGYLGNNWQYGNWSIRAGSIAVGAQGAGYINFQRGDTSDWLTSGYFDDSGKLNLNEDLEVNKNTIIQGNLTMNESKITLSESGTTINLNPRNNQNVFTITKTFNKSGLSKGQIITIRDDTEGRNTTGDTIGLEYKVWIDAEKGGRSSGFLTGITGQTNVNLTDQVCSIATGMDSQIYNRGNGTLTTAFGIRSLAKTFEYGNITNVKLFDARTPVNASEGYITGNMYGYYVDEMGLLGTQNSYGIYIEDQTGVSQNPFSIYSVGGENYFGGKTSIASNLSVGNAVQSGITLYDEDGNARCMNCWSDGVCNSTSGAC